MSKITRHCLALPLAAVLALPMAAAASEDAPAAPTFHRDVAPILYQHCAECHRPGQIAPMSLLEYREVRPWAKSIRTEVREREMPPWHADSSRVRYTNDRSLPQEKIDTIVRWVEAGAPEGDPAEAPPRPAFDDGWRLGPPDRIFRAKKSFTVPVTDEEIPYQSITFDVDLDEDLYLRAWEIRPGQRKAVHHANLVRSPADLDGKEVGIASAVLQGGDYIGSYLPGHSHVVYPKDIAYKLPKGSHLGIQVHYVSLDEPVEDWLEFGVYFAEGRVDQLVRVIGTDYRSLEIPPYEPHYEIVDEVELLHDLWALSSGIHMHLRGKSYTMEAVLPDGEVKLITEVPEYDFNWQSNYVLAEPVFMPQGTKFRVTSVWDNSADNPLNPDPSATVRYGPWTNDEMVNSWAHVVLDGEHLGLKIEDGRLAGRFEDAQTSQQPFLLQTLPQAPSFHRGEPDSSGSSGSSDSE